MRIDGAPTVAATVERTTHEHAPRCCPGHQPTNQPTNPNHACSISRSLVQVLFLPVIMDDPEDPEFRNAILFALVFSNQYDGYVYV